MSSSRVQPSVHPFPSGRHGVRIHARSMYMYTLSRKASYRIYGGSSSRDHLRRRASPVQKFGGAAQCRNPTSPTQTRSNLPRSQIRIRGQRRGSQKKRWTAKTTILAVRSVSYTWIRGRWKKGVGVTSTLNCDFHRLSFGHVVIFVSHEPLFLFVRSYFFLFRR